MPFRPATAADYIIFERLFDELGTGDPTPTRHAWEHAFAPHAFMLEREGEVVGYVYLQIFDGLGYVRHVIVDPRHRGQGVGQTLMQEAARRVREAGVARWCLNVMPDNEAAVRLYRHMGMTFQYASVAMRMGWDMVARLPAAEPGIDTELLEPADDTATEQALELPAGLLARQRRSPVARLLVSRCAGEPVGVAAFIPSFPGAYPFRARSVGVMRGMIDAMLPLADPTFDYVQLVLEDAPTLADALEQAGAVRHLSYVHYAGDVPTT